jgi:hypothetical protein
MRKETTPWGRSAGRGSCTQIRVRPPFRCDLSWPCGRRFGSGCVLRTASVSISRSSALIIFRRLWSASQNSRRHSSRASRSLIFRKLKAPSRKRRRRAESRHLAPRNPAPLNVHCAVRSRIHERPAERILSLRKVDAWYGSVRLITKKGRTSDGTSTEASGAGASSLSRCSPPCRRASSPSS